MPSEKDNIRNTAKALNDQGTIEFHQNHVEKAFELCHEAAHLLASIAEDDDDWRNLAMYQNNTGAACQEQEKKLILAEKAVNSLKKIPENNFTYADWRNLAKYQYTLTGFRTGQKLQLLEQAITSLNHIPENDLTFNDWRLLAKCENNAGIVYSDREKRLVRFTKAMSCLTQIPENDLTIDDRRVLAISQNNISNESLGLAEKQLWLKKALDNFTHITKINPSCNDWDDLGTCQNNTALFYKRIKNWEKAQEYFYAALDAYQQSKHYIAYDRISNVYKNLCEIVPPLSLEYQFYHFASQIFSDVKLPNFETQLLQFHMEILKPISQMSHLRRGLPQLLRLLQTTCEESSFPNGDIKKWLIDNPLLLKEKLQAAEEAYQPVSLLNMIDQAPTLNVAIVQKLALLEAMINELKLENQNLKQENEELRNAQNVYQGKLTLFEKNLNGNPSISEESPSIAENRHARACSRMDPTHKA